MRPKFGFGRMKIMEIISFALKENILNSRELVACETKFFPVLFTLCKNYQYNNVLHNDVVRIVEVALNEPEDSKFLKSVPPRLLSCSITTSSSISWWMRSTKTN
jgi:hypothetical protein